MGLGLAIDMMSLRDKPFFAIIFYQHFFPAGNIRRPGSAKF